MKLIPLVITSTYYLNIHLIKSGYIVFKGKKRKWGKKWRKIFSSFASEKKRKLMIKRNKLTMLFNDIDRSRCGITFGCHRCTGKIQSVVCYLNSQVHSPSVSEWRTTACFCLGEKDLERCVERSPNPRRNDTNRFPSIPGTIKPSTNRSPDCKIKVFS